jgi:hypothetical protein
MMRIFGEKRGKLKTWQLLRQFEMGAGMLLQYFDKLNIIIILFPGLVTSSAQGF